MPQTAPSFAELLEQTRTSAVHLEMRDSYGVAGEADTFAAFLRGDWNEEAQRAERSNWLNMVSAATARGVVIRRARIVSEPVSDYIRYEHAGTQMNIDAGDRSAGSPGAAPSTSRCRARTSGCSTAGWCSCTTGPVPATGTPMSRRCGPMTPPW